MRFSGKTAIVTGGASGIGEATVRRLAEEGANVVVAYSSNSAGADKLVAELANASGKVVAMKVNVTSEEDVKAMAEKTVKEFGKIDILVNNAGTVETYFKPHEMPTEVFDKTMNINARGVFLCCKYCIPSMLENKSGVIVNVASTIAVKAAPCGISYAASKRAVIGLTEQLCYEYGNSGIRVNAVCPGTTETKLVAHFVYDEAYQQSIRGIPTGRVAQPVDIADAIVFLASDEADYIHGVHLVVDGGCIIKEQ